MRRRVLVVVGLGLLVGLLILVISRRNRGSGAPAAVADRRPERAQTPVTGQGVPTLRTAPRARIAGRVHDRVGAPIAGATVCAKGTTEGRLSSAELREPTCATTARDGSYELVDLYPIRWSLDAWAPRHRPAEWTSPPPALDRDFALAPGEERRGFDITLDPDGVEVHTLVKDIGGGPIAGARVVVQRAAFFAFDGEGAAATGRSDDKGELSLWVAPGPIMVRAEAEGYAPGLRTGQAPGPTVTVVLVPETVIAGQVVEAGSGTPVPDVLVIARTAERALGEVRGGTALSDGAGHFRIDRLTPGRYQVRAVGDGLRGQSAGSVLARLGATAEVTIEVRRAARVRVHVRARSGAACSDGDAQVSLQGPVQGWQNARIQRDGEAWFRALEPGTYRVKDVSCAGYALSGERAPIVVSDRDLEVDVTVEPAGHIAGWIGYQDGRPMAPVYMSATPPGQMAGMAGVRTSSEPDGTFRFEGVAAGSYEITTFGETAVDPPVHVDMPASGSIDDLRIVQATPGRIAAKVVDTRGAPVPNVGVSAQGGKWMPITRMTDGDGRVEIPDLEPGSYRLWVVRKPSFRSMPLAAPADQANRSVEVTSGKTVEATLVIEPLDGSIRGHVLDGDGKPITDAFVHAVPEEKDGRPTMRWSWDRASSMTDMDGAFTIDALAKGTYLVHAFRGGGGEAFAEHVTTGSTVALTIRTTGSLSGTAVLSDGSAAERFVVRAREATSGLERVENFTGGAEWAVRDLPPGRYSLYFDAARGTAAADLQLEPGEDKAGIVVRLDARAQVSGRAVDLDTGQPIKGAHASVVSAHQQVASVFFTQSDDGISGPDGRFLVARAPAGPSRLVVFSDDAHSPVVVTGLALAPGATKDMGTLPLARYRLPHGAKPGDLGLVLRRPEGADPMEPFSGAVSAVQADGPAAAAGLRAGDTIVAVDGHDVTGAAAYLLWPLTAVPPGTTVKLEVTGAGGDRRALSVTAR